jgi:hypothetical protein
MLLGMPSCNVTYTRHCCPGQPQLLNLFSTVSRVQKGSSIDVWNSKTGVFLMGRVESLPFLLKTLPEARYWVLTSEGKKIQVSYSSKHRQRSNWTWKKYRLEWFDLKQRMNHTDRFQVPFFNEGNTVRKGYTGTLEDLKKYPKSSIGSGFPGIFFNEPAALILTLL